MTRHGASPFRILVVCTANVCRSVMAERMLRRIVAERELDVEVDSCGLLFDGKPASDTVIAVLAEREIDASDHSSRKFEPGLLHGIDLVVTMERGHARDLAIAIDGATDRIHTLGGFVKWLESVERTGETSPRELVAQCATARASSALLGGGPDEVADPYGRSKRVNRKTADRLAELSRSLVDGLFGDPEI